MNILIPLLELCNSSAPIQSLSASEVSASAGCFGFASDGLGLENRVIIWRTDGPNLYVDEFSTDSDLHESSLCLSFTNTKILPGTQIIVYRGFLIVVVPTQSSLHWFYISLNSATLRPNYSVLSLFPEECDLKSPIYGFYWLTTTGTAKKAEVTITREGKIIVAFQLTNLPLVLVSLPHFGSDNRVVSETILREGNIVTKLLKNIEGQNNIIDLNLIADGFDAKLISIDNDGRLILWSTKEKRVVGTSNVYSLNKTPNENMAESFLVKFAQSSSTIVVCIQYGDRAKFMLVKINEQNHSFSVLAITAIKTRHVIDFMVTPVVKNKEDEYSLWVLIAEAMDQDEREQTPTQPYSLWKCAISLLSDTPNEWTRVRAAVPDSSMDDILFHSTTIDAIRHRIFNGDDYSFDSVQRAVTITCKRPVVNIAYNDWSNLIGFVEDFLQSGQFKQTYLGADDRNSLLILNPIDQQAWDEAIEKFWIALYKCCNQFQEAGLQAFRIWFSQELDLVGVVQQCRFTVYHPPDEHMRYMLNSTVDKHYIKECFLMAEKCAKNDLRIELTIPENQRQTVLDNFLSNIDDLCRVIRLFAEHCPIDISTNLVACNSLYLASSFTTGLLSTAFRHRILGRLHFSHLVNAVIRLVTQLMKKLHGNDDRWDSIVRTHDSTVLQTLRYYSMLWTALSNRVDCLVPDEDGILRHMTVAQAFFKYGNETMVKRLTNGRTHFLDEEEDDEDEPELSSRRGSSNQMRTAVYLSNPATTEFSKFIRDTLDAAMITLWPESTALTLPRFLTQNGYFEALQNYCLLNEPFISELAYAFRFFQGVAFSGLGHPQMAFESFIDALIGIDTEDDALNNVLSYLGQEQQRKLHTEIEYLYTVMKFFKEHGHEQAVITIGDIIIQKAKEDINIANDPQLSAVHMLLFRQYMSSENYAEAVHAILANSDQELQRGCLRDLVFVLLQTEKYKIFIDLDYKQLTPQVIEILDERCKNPDLTWESPIFDIYYAFHIQRCEFIEAARVMYEFSGRLRYELQNREVFQKRCRVLATVFQTMHMLPESERLILHVNIDPKAKYRMNTDFNDISIDSIDENQIQNSEETEYVLTKEEVQKELIKSEARLSLLDAYEKTNVPPLNEVEIMQESIKQRLYDMAWLLISIFDLDSNDLFADVTYQCILLDLEREDDPDYEDPLWVVHNRKFVDDSKGHIERHWKILIAYIDLELQRTPANARILRTIAYTFLKYSLKLPAWLVQKYMKVNFSDFLRTLIDFNELTESYRHLLPYLDSILKSVNSDRSNFLLPITAIDELLYLSDQSDLDLPIDETKTKIKLIADRYKNFCMAAENF